MIEEGDTNNMLSVLDNYMLETTDDIALKLAEDFRHRRIEKNLTREQIGERAGISASNIVRFEQKGLISLKNLIAIAVALGYTSEIKNLFETPKYSTMEELMQIRRNTGKKRHTENHDVIAVTAAVHVPKLFSMMKMDIG